VIKKIFDNERMAYQLNECAAGKRRALTTACNRDSETFAVQSPYERLLEVDELAKQPDFTKRTRYSSCKGWHTLVCSGGLQLRLNVGKMFYQASYSASEALEPKALQPKLVSIYFDGVFIRIMLVKFTSAKNESSQDPLEVFEGLVTQHEIAFNLKR